MAAEIYQGGGIDPGFVQGPSADGFRSTFGAAEAQRGAAISGLGSDVSSFADKLYHAQQVTKLNDATTSGLTAFNDLDTKYAHAPDVDGFTKDSQKLIGDTIGNSGLDPQYQAELRTRLTRLSIGSQSTVQKAAWTNDQASNLANLTQADTAYQTRYLRAGSDAERDAVLADQQRNVSGLVAAGWIDADKGQRQVDAFRSSAQQSHAAKLISDDPKTAIATLNDPAQYPNLDPVRRQNLVDQAKGAQDSQGLLQANLLAQRAPAAAAAGVGRTLDPRVASEIFQKGVIPIESGGNPNAESSAGAAGLTQMIPGTARAAATREGMADVAALDDASLKARLKADPVLAVRLGQNEFNRLLTRYDGSVPAALAAYNAGPGNADKPRADAWHAQAVAQFGQNYTADQFASLVPIKETHDYIGKVYGKLGAPTDGFGLTTTGNLRAQTSVLSEIQSQGNERKRLTNQLASLGRDADPVTDQLKAGYDVAPERLAAYTQTQSAAAANGDPAAIRALRELDHARAIAPIVQGAYQMPPSQLAATVAAESQRLAQSPNVLPAESDHLDAMKTVLSNVNSLKGTNPVGLAERAGMFRAAPIDAASVGTPQFAQALRDRDGQAVAASRAYDGNLVPFKPEETDALRNRWNGADANGKVALAGAIGGAMRPDTAEAAIRQIAGGDRLNLTAGLLATRDPALATKVLQGATLLDSPGVKPKVADVRTALGDVMRGQVYISPQMQNDALEAGMAVYAANRASSQSLFSSSDRDGLEGAIQEVTGKIVSVNGARTPIPPGFSPAMVSRGMRDLTVDDLKDAGGLQPGLDPSFVGNRGQLHALKIGGTAYAVTVGDRPVMTAAGDRPLVVDLAHIGARQALRNRPWQPQSAADANDAVDADRKYDALGALL